MIKEELSKTQYKEVEELLDKGIKSIIDELKSLEKEVTSLKASVLMLQVKKWHFCYILWGNRFVCCRRDYAICE